MQSSTSAGAGNRKQDRVGLFLGGEEAHFNNKGDDIPMAGGYGLEGISHEMWWGACPGFREKESLTKRLSVKESKEGDESVIGKRIREFIGETLTRGKKWLRS